MSGRQERKERMCVMAVCVHRIRGKGYELFRLGYPGLVHYFHSKAGMWGHRSR